MMVCNGLKDALISALRENGIKSAEQYGEALNAFNEAFGEVVQQTVLDAVQRKAKVPLLTQVFNINQTVDDVPFIWSSKSEVDASSANTLASTAFYQKTGAMTGQADAGAAPDADVEAFAVMSTSAATTDVARYKVCKVTSGGKVVCFEYPPS